MVSIDLQTLQNLLKDNANNILPTTLSLKLAKLKKEVEENTNIYREVLLRLINNYAKIDDEGKPIINDNGDIFLKEGCEKDWQREYAELENSDMKYTITFTQDEVEKLSITPAEAETLLKFIK